MRRQVITGRDASGNLTWGWDDRGASRAVPNHGRPTLYAVDGGAGRVKHYVDPEYQRNATVIELEEAAA